METHRHINIVIDMHRHKYSHRQTDIQLITDRETEEKQRSNPQTNRHSADINQMEDKSTDIHPITDRQMADKRKHTDRNEKRKVTPSLTQT